jgi:CheY-like chemotaxis protein
MSANDRHVRGCRVLVVEDEYFIADDLKSVLEARGAYVVGPVGDLAEAIACVERNGFDVAILDINLRDEEAYVVADELVRQKIPFIFATGYAADAIPARFKNVIRLEKPYEGDKVAEAVGLLCPAASLSPA